MYKYTYSCMYYSYFSMYDPEKKIHKYSYKCMYAQI